MQWPRAVVREGVRHLQIARSCLFREDVCYWVIGSCGHLCWNVYCLSTEQTVALRESKFLESLAIPAMYYVGHSPPNLRKNWRRNKILY